MQYRQADISFEIEKMKQEAQLKSMLMREEFEMNMQLRQARQPTATGKGRRKEKTLNLPE